MKTLLNRKNSDGFTLLEMVVAVGVLLALAVGGFLAYNGIQHRAKVAVTEAAAQEVYNGGRLAQEQGQAATTARDEFNATTDAITTDIEEKSDRTICATAVHQDDNEITASRGNCSGESGSVITPPEENEEEEQHNPVSATHQVNLYFLDQQYADKTVKFTLLNKTVGKEDYIQARTPATTQHTPGGVFGGSVTILLSDEETEGVHEYEMEVNIDGEIFTKEFTSDDLTLKKKNVKEFDTHTSTDYDYYMEFELIDGELIETSEWKEYYFGK